MTITIDLAPEIAERFQQEAATLGQDTGEYLKQWVEQQMLLQDLEALRHRKPPQSLDELKPRIPPPPGSNGFAETFGQWPGDETDEEIQAALDAIS